MNGQLYVSAALPPEERAPGIRWIGAGWALEAVWMLWRGEKSSPPQASNSNPSAIQTVASCYTDYSIPALKFKITEKLL